MEAIPKDVMQEIIRGQNFKNPAEVYSFLKESFKQAGLKVKIYFI